MIIRDGKVRSAQREQQVSSGGINPSALGELVKLFGDKFEQLMSEVRKREVFVGTGKEQIYVEDQESLRNIAEIMAKRTGVEETNIRELGTIKSVKDVTGNKNRTIDLLSDIEG